METTTLPVDVGHWLLALLPIVVLLILLVVLRWKTPEAGPVGMFAAAALALLFFQVSWRDLSVAGAKGVWDAIFILIRRLAGAPALPGDESGGRLRCATYRHHAVQPQ